MVQKILAMVEAHIEKAILAGCALFAAYVAWGFLLGSPNTIEFNNQTYGPGTLHEAINQEAAGLESAVRNATPEEIEGEDVKFQDQLQERLSAGIFARKDEAPPIPNEVRIATGFGSKIEVPGLEIEEESVELVTPLQPAGLTARVGRSMVYKQNLLVGLGGEEDAIADEDAKPVEQPWVTVAGYFDTKAQYQEMINAGYAAYRARVYLVGVEVRRQEVQSDGSFSEPEVVSPTNAMPVVEIEEPQFDDDDGSLVNKQEMDVAFRTIKAQQAVLQQPPFYLVDDGDFWEVPPLEGLDEFFAEPEEELAATEADPLGGRSSGRPAGGMRPGGPGGMQPPAAGGNRGGRPGAGARGGRPGAGGATFGNPGGGGGSRNRGPSEAQQKAAARRELKKNLEDAQAAVSAGDFRRAVEMAGNVEANENATGSDKKKAKAIIKRAEQLEARAMRFAGSSGALPQRITLMNQTIENPETGAPAVWFHDDSVESGKTYRYSMRVKLWNRYVGQTRAMKDPADAREPILVGEWSNWGNPITVTPETYFFVAGAKPGDDVEALCEVWKWRNGAWIKERFDVRVGDVVGNIKTVKTSELDENLKEVRADVDFTTGAVILDLRLNEKIQQRIPGKGDFSYREQDSVVIVYLDPADGQVKEKSAVLDRNDPLRKQLEEAEL